MNFPNENKDGGMMYKLKPCPYCKGKAMMRYRMPYTIIYCKNGCAEISVSDSYEQEDSKDEAVKEWNRMASKAKKLKKSKGVKTK